MNAWNLLWIVPLCLFAGYFIAALMFAASHRGDVE